MIDGLYLEVFAYIASVLFGVLIGNFTTTVFYRLPRGIMIAGFDQQTTRPPFCSNCGHLLLFYEYLPILSWFSALGKCNYCNIPITKIYMVLEVSGGLISLILYSLFKHNLEYFFIYFCLSELILLNIFIYLEHNFIPASITLGIIILGMIYRTLTDHEIFSWLAGFIIACMLGTGFKQKNKNTDLPHLIIPASLWYNNYIILIFGIIVGILFVIKKYKNK